MVRSWGGSLSSHIAVKKMKYSLGPKGSKTVMTFQSFNSCFKQTKQTHLNLSRVWANNTESLGNAHDMFPKQTRPVVLSE